MDVGKGYMHRGPYDESILVVFLLLYEILFLNMFTVDSEFYLAPVMNYHKFTFCVHPILILWSKCIACVDIFCFAWKARAISLQRMIICLVVNSSKFL